MSIKSRIKTFRKGGIHPRADKLTAGDTIIAVTPTSELRLLLGQSLGKPSICSVKAGDRVEAGDKIAEAGGFMGAPLHAPCAGTVAKTEQTRDAQGYWRDSIVLTVSPESDTPCPSARSRDQVSAMTPEEIIALTAASGIVGLGGAAFPTAVKLTVPEGKHAECVIINGAECEPYLTCDDRLMRENAGEILLGAELLARAVGASRIFVGIEENKPEAIEAMREAAAAHVAVTAVEIVVLRKKYPQGGEKQLIEAISGREVPAGGLPIDIGAIVDNVATAYALYEAAYLGRPLTHRVVTVTGPALTRPGNYRVPVGMPISKLIEIAGGIPGDTGKVIAGGPMMGRAISNPDAPVTKGLSGVLVLPESLSRRKAETACIRCARCVGVCPMGLEPYLLADLSEFARWEDDRDNGVMNCLECGSCSYICPASRPLLDHIRLARQQVRALPRYNS